MPRVREIKRCRAYVVTERAANGAPIEWRQCLAPATARDGLPSCEHGQLTRTWTERYAPRPNVA